MTIDCPPWWPSEVQAHLKNFDKLTYVGIKKASNTDEGLLSIYKHWFSCLDLH